MLLTQTHLIFENDCRQIFIGKTINGVIYGECKNSIDEEEVTLNPEPGYITNFPEIDTLDYSIYLKTEDKAIYIFWDNSFVCYGLSSKQLDFNETTNDYEQKWDVSRNKKWKDIIGQKIVGFIILWEETWKSDINGSNKIYITYPQAFKITTSRKDTIIISASEFDRQGKNTVSSQDSNLLVTTDLDLAEQLGIIASI